jgi:hypothetical protein
MVRTPREREGVREIGLEEERKITLAKRSTIRIDALRRRTDVPCVLGLLLGSP